MCADPVTMALTAFGTMTSFYGQQQAAKAQAASYKNQAAADEQNARIAARQAENTADSYAQQQEEIRNRMKIARGAQSAAAGSMGVDGASGSQLEVLGGGFDAYNQDAANLLTNQRNNVWGSQMQEYNFLQSAASNRVAAGNVKSAAKWAGLGTILGGAASIYGLPKKTSSVGGTGSALGPITTDLSNGYTATFSGKNLTVAKKKSNPWGLDGKLMGY